MLVRQYLFLHFSFTLNFLFAQNYAFVLPPIMKGIIFGFIVGLMFGHLDSDTAWRCMFGMGIILPSIMIILLWTVMPESPRWLVQQERDMDAAHVLQKIYGKGTFQKSLFIYIDP